MIAVDCCAGDMWVHAELASGGGANLLSCARVIVWILRGWGGRCWFGNGMICHVVISSTIYVTVHNYYALSTYTIIIER